MPGSIHISAAQPQATTPLFLQVAVGKREYGGIVEQDDLSIPVTSLRESMVLMLYNAEKELISKEELKTKAIVESGTMDVVFTLGSGGQIILQLQFLLGDDDRKRIQEMRNSAMKRKQQELLGGGSELNFPGSPLSKRLIEKISSIQSKVGPAKLRKSMSLDDLQDRAVYSGMNVDARMKASRDLLVQSGGRNASRFEGPDSSRKGNNKSSSSVKKMISAFEGTSSQDLASDTSGASLTASSGSSAQAAKAIVRFGDNKGSDDRPGSGPGKHVVSQHKRWSAGESRRSRRSSSSRDGASKQKMREREGVVSRSKRRCEAQRVRSYWLGCPLNYLVATSSSWIHPHVCVTTASRQLRELLELELGRSLRGGEEGAVESTRSSDAAMVMASGHRQGGGIPLLALNGWLINQGVRATIVVIACGAMFLSNR